jgi:hypothetical protein
MQQIILGGYFLRGKMNKKITHEVKRRNLDGFNTQAGPSRASPYF